MADERHIDVVMRLIDGITEPLKRVQSQMENTANLNRRLGRTVQNVGKSITNVGKAMLPVAATIVGAAVAGGKAFTDFDAIITSAGAKANATVEEMDKLRTVGAKLGADFPISATDAARGIDQLAAAGYDANQIIGAMPAIVTASVAAGEDLATTSDVVSNALNIWNLKNGDIAQSAAHVADVVQQAANLSSLGMQDFGLAMQYAGAPAASLNISIEELATAMALMKNKGIDASQIGTSLRSTLARLADPPKDAAVALSQLGIQTTDANGNFIGLKNVIDQLRTSMNGLSNTQQTAYAQAISGTTGYSGLLSLLSTAPEIYAQMEDAIKNSDGSSAKQYEVMSQTFKVTLDNLMGGLESLAISMGTLFAPQMTAATNSLAKMVDWLNELDPSTKKMIGNVAIGFVAITGATLAVGQLTHVVGTAIRRWGDLGKAFNASATSTKTADVVVRNLRSGLEQTRTAAINFSTTVVGGFNKMRALTWSDIGMSMSSGITRARASLLSTFDAIRSSATNAGMSVANSIRSFSMANTLASARTALINFAGGIRTVTRASLGFIASPMGLAIIAIAGAAYLLYKNWNTVGPYLTSIWQKISGAIGSAWEKIQPALNSLGKAVQPLIDAFKKLFSDISAGQGIWGTITSTISFLAQLIGGALVANLFIAISVISNALVMAINIAGTVIAGFIGVLEGIITFLTGVFIGNWEMAWQGIVKVFSSIFETVKGIAEAVVTGIKDTINTVIDGINSISVTIPEWVPSVGGQQFGPLGIPRLHTGTEYWQGGTAMVHDKGAEIIDLPTGSRVIPHDAALNEMYNRGKKSSVGHKIMVNIEKLIVSNGDDYDKVANEIASRILHKMEIEALNMQEGAV